MTIKVIDEDLNEIDIRVGTERVHFLSTNWALQLTKEEALNLAQEILWYMTPMDMEHDINTIIFKEITKTPNCQ